MEALLYPDPEAPLAHIFETQLSSLRQISDLFQDYLNKPGAPLRVVQTPPAQIVGDPELTRVACIITALSTGEYNQSSFTHHTIC